jgi:hypothetical protein
MNFPSAALSIAEALAARTAKLPGKAKKISGAHCGPTILWCQEKRLQWIVVWLRQRALRGEPLKLEKRCGPRAQAVRVRKGMGSVLRSSQ